MSLEQRILSHKEHPEFVDRPYKARSYRLIAGICREFSKGRSTCLVEVGCGPARVADYLEPFVSYVGLDFNDSYVLDPWRPSNSRQFVVADIINMPIATSSADIVLASHVIEHIPYELQGSLLAELRRVIRQNGILILGTPNLGTLLNRQSFLPPADPRHIGCLKLSQVKQLLLKNGFDKVRRYPFDLFMESPTPLLEHVPYPLRQLAAGAAVALDKELWVTAKPR